MSNQHQFATQSLDYDRISTKEEGKNPEDMNQDSQVLKYNVGLPIYSLNFSNKRTIINGHESILLGVGSCLPHNN